MLFTGNGALLVGCFLKTAKAVALSKQYRSIDATHAQGIPRGTLFLHPRKTNRSKSKTCYDRKPESPESQPLRMQLPFARRWAWPQRDWDASKDVREVSTLKAIAVGVCS